MAPHSIWLDMPLRNIQSVRLAHALTESSHHLHLSDDVRGQFAHLSKFFDLKYSIGRGEALRLPGIEIDHATPLTKVGHIERPLIFPAAIFERCRRAWPSTRSVQFFFAGLMTKERERTLREWSRNSGREIRVPRRLNFFSKWLNRWTGPRAPAKSESEGVTFWSSERGREYPVKAWDEDYHHAMSQARFVLCPSGDFVWTYRFFESAICGAIPVVEGACPAYDGFQFFTMQQPAAELKWTAEVVEHNFQLCRRRLTIPRPELDAELARLLAAPPPQ
jgi:hypothetical protein